MNAIVINTGSTWENRKLAARVAEFALSRDAHIEIRTTRGGYPCIAFAYEKDLGAATVYLEREGVSADTYRVTTDAEMVPFN